MLKRLAFTLVVSSVSIMAAAAVPNGTPHIENSHDWIAVNKAIDNDWHQDNSTKNQSNNLVPLDGVDGKPNKFDENDAKVSIEYDLEKLPSAVRQLREKIILAAKAGDLDALRPLFETGSDATQLSLAQNVADPVKYIKELSGDGEGLETLAILIDLFNSGYAHINAGEDDEIYVWPYFFALPLDDLSKPQLVELFQIMTAGDLEQMKEIGAYSFYRIGITPDGKWRFFVTGD